MSALKVDDFCPFCCPGINGGSMPIPTPGERIFYTSSQQVRGSVELGQEEFSYFIVCYPWITGVLFWCICFSSLYLLMSYLQFCTWCYSVYPGKTWCLFSKDLYSSGDYFLFLKEKEASVPVEVKANTTWGLTVTLQTSTLTKLREEEITRKASIPPECNLSLFMERTGAEKWRKHGDKWG